MDCGMVWLDGQELGSNKTRKLANEATDKQLISKIYKQLLQLNSKKKKKKWPNQKMGQRTK